MIQNEHRERHKPQNVTKYDKNGVVNDAILPERDIK